MSVRLTVTERTGTGEDKPVEFVLDEATITLGRDKNCQVVLPQQAVSRAHARILQDGQLDPATLAEVRAMLGETA